MTPVAPARSDSAAEILGQDRSTVKDVEPANPAALAMPSTDARQSSTAFAPRPEVFVCRINSLKTIAMRDLNESLCKTRNADESLLATHTRLIAETWLFRAQYQFLFVE